MKCRLPHIYRMLYRIRRVEEEIARIYPSDKIKSPIHLSIGQEFISVGVCDVLRRNDAVFGTYRSHALYLAKGGSLKAMLAELYGKAAGCARGKGGSMHLIAPEVNLFGTSAVVGTTIPHAVGFAYAMRVLRSKRIVVSFFGDGATEEGVFHESLNFAAIKRLPILFVCENNGYAIHSPLWQRQPSENISDRVRGYGIPVQRISSGNVLLIRAVAARMVEALRGKGKGPLFLECKTYRWKEHVGPNDDWHLGYRDPREAEPWKKKDALKQVGSLLGQEQRTYIEKQVEAELAEAIAFAETSPFPTPSELHKHVFREAR